MTDILVTDVGDAWVHSGKTGLNTGSTAWVQVKSGERRGFVWPPLTSLTGRTVLAASLTGRVGPGHVAQTYTFAPITERWSPGRLTWANQPAVNAAAAVTVTVGALPDGGLVVAALDAMLSAVAAGTEWFGVRISTNSSADDQKFYATDSGLPAWELAVTLSDAPEQPTNLRPDGAAVSSAVPILAWDSTDLGGESTEQASFKIQVDTPAALADPDDVSPDFDSGWVLGTDPQFDLDASAHTPAGAGPHYWRVMTKDAGGTASEWSDWAFYTVTSLPTLTIDSPTGPFGDPSPTLLAHLTGATDITWKAVVTGPDRSDVRIHSGIQASATGEVVWQIPERNKDNRRVLREDQECWIHLRVWDDEDRAFAVGQAPYVEAWVPALFDDDLGVTAPTSLTVVQPVANDPRLRWTFAIPEAPEAVLLQADDVTVQRVDLADLTVSGGFYSVLDNGGVPPLRPVELSVRAVEDAKRSSKASHPVTHSHTVQGVWLVPDDTDPILLDGTTVGDFVRTDRVATYTPLVGPEIEVVYDYVGKSGSFAGSVDNRDGDVWVKIARLESLAASRNRTVRMVWGSHSITARLSDVDVSASDDITTTNLLHNVRFRFVEVGD